MRPKKMSLGIWGVVVNFFVTYWSQIVTILLATAGVAIQVLQKGTFGIEAVLLSVLLLIAVSQITNNRRLDSVLDYFEYDKVSADKFLMKSVDRQKLSDLLRKAKSIDLMGVNLKDSLDQWNRVLEESVKGGAKVRVLLVDPQSVSIDAVALRSNGEDKDMLQVCHTFTVRKLDRLSKLARLGGEVNIKYIKYPPSFALLLVDNGRLNAMGLVKMYCHNGVTDGVYPVFEVYPWRERWWYEYFVEQFDSQWNSEESATAIL